MRSIVLIPPRIPPLNNADCITNPLLNSCDL
jgi:hypothetical protein